jgi:predicted transcriptional regulator
MKKQNIFKEALLVSQEDMAILLGVSRSQWSMYTIGQRGLSTQGKVKLEQMVRSVNQVSFSKEEKLPQEVLQESEIKKVLENLLLDNKLNQLQFQKKLSQMEEKFQLALNTLHFVINLQAKKSKWNANEPVLQVLKMKANKVLKANGLPKQEVCKVKLEGLVQEEKLLIKRKKKL